MLGEHSAVAVTPWLRVFEFVLRSRPGDLWLLLDFKPSLLRSHDGSDQTEMLGCFECRVTCEHEKITNLRKGCPSRFLKRCELAICWNTCPYWRKTCALFLVLSQG